MKYKNYPNKQLNHLKAIVICHGESEYHIARYIKSNLRIKLEIDAKDKGKHSIQIKSILNHLSSNPYKSEKEFIRKYKNDLINREINNNFKIFIIMDTDDEELTERDIENFKNKSMFKVHWAYDYIVPIFNTRNLEEVLLKAKIIDKTFDDKKEYTKIFPINNNAGMDDVKQIRNISDTLKPIPNTNMDILLEYLLELVQ